MKILDFDIRGGIYHFELDDLKAEEHAHPVVEFISTIDDDFSLVANGAVNDGIKFAIIDANVKHHVTINAAKVSILMIESRNGLLSKFLEENSITLNNGIWISNSSHAGNSLLKVVRTFAAENNLLNVGEPRIQNCLSLIDQGQLDYKDMIPTLKEVTHLSEGRLSHLFKDTLGLSLKKYMVWNRLKKAIELLLNEEKNLTQVALESGFFDQAHLTNAFKRMLGISPSTTYNSRTIQF